jgi:hypothetical protein
VPCGTQVPSRASLSFAYGPITLYQRAFQLVSATLAGPMSRALQPQGDESPWFGLFRVRSPLLAESLLISFPPGTEMFHFPGLASPCLCIEHGMDDRVVSGFPIRTPPDQRLLSTSPKLFAASHVLHRLCAPRHPPSALSSLTIQNRSRLGVEAPTSAAQPDYQALIRN